MQDQDTARRRRALLIGINRYANLPEHQQLDGCCNDVELMQGVLTSKFNFPPDDVRMLQDEQATRDGILEALDELVAETGDDDIVVLHYAGHGSQMRDREGDEGDGMDETIVPHDAGRPPAPNREITDDELHLRLRRLAERTRNITLIFDCCHSGTIVRDMAAAKARQLEPDPRPPEELPPSPLSAEERTAGAKSRGPSGWFPVGDRYVLLSGCRDEERSYEYSAENDGEPVPHGALTWFLTDALMRAVPGTTYRDIFEHVSATVSGTNPAQHPQIEGTLERELFGIRDIEPMRFVAVQERAPGSRTVTLAGGAAIGLTPGSRWDVLPRGAKTADAATRLGHVRIATVGATQATATIEEETEPGAIDVGTRCVETAHDYGEMRMAVRLEGDREAAPAAWAALEERIAASGLLRLTDAPGPRVRVMVVPPRARAGADDPVPQIGALAVPMIVAVTEAGELMMPPKHTGEVSQVVENLEQWARFRMKLAIRNEGSALDGTVKLELLRREAGGWVPIEADPAGGMRTVHVGDTIDIRLTNQGGVPLHVALFDFTPGGRVKLLFPFGRAEPLQPGVAKLLGNGQGFPASWPKEFPYLPNPFVDTPDAATETLKIFVTTEETDFRYLEQEAASRDLHALPNPLQRLMAAAHSGGATRDLEPVPPDDWTTAVLPFSLRHRTDTELVEGQAVKVAGVTMRAEGVSGRVERMPKGPPAPPGASARRPVLASVLESQHMKPTRSFALNGTAAVAGTRGADAAVAIEAEAPPEGWGNLVLSVDEAGVVGWHFAEETSAERTGTRSMPTGRHTFRIPQGAAAESVPDGAPAHRGIAGVLGRKVLEMLVFPLLDPVFGAVADGFASRWEAQRRPYGLRTFTPDDYRSAAGAPIDAERWRGLGEGRALLFIHGTFSTSNNAFHGMPRETLELLHRMYGGRVFAFDHPTVSADPRENVEWLLERIPGEAKLDVDVICHSRGGLVSRVLAERGREMGDGGGRIGIGRVLFAGSPNAGTALADPRHMGAFLDSYTNLLNFFDVLPDNGVTEILDAVVTVAKQAAVGALGGLEGLQSMRPGGDFERWLGASTYAGSVRYFAVASDFTPRAPGLRERLADRVMDRVFGGAPNDLVVPAASVYEGERAPLFPIVERMVLTGDDAVGHSGYFAAPGVGRKMLEWLGQDG